MGKELQIGEFMSSDLTLAVDNGFVNIRVGAIIIKNGKFLMVKNDAADYLYSVGGRIKYGETSEEAVRREVFEETGINLEIDRLGFVHENFFYGDTGKTLGKPIYEISFFYFMKTPSDFTPKCQSCNDIGEKEGLVWVSPKSQQKIFPEFFRTELFKPQSGVKHIVVDERK